MGAIDTLGKGSFSIFGSGRVAAGTAWMIQELTARIPDCFVVTDLTGQPETIMGRPVLRYCEYKEKTGLLQETEMGLLLIAIPESGQQEVVRRCIFDRIPYLCITNDIENELSVKYYRRIGWKRIFDGSDNSCNGLLFSDRRKEPECTVYLSKCVWDVPLVGEYDIPEYVVPVQGGAALTDKVIADICDNRGDNISAKNPYYCELTVLYWIWKNALHAGTEYLGLCHYRRIFALTKAQMFTLLSGEPDVVLLYPSVHLPDSGQHEQRYIPRKIREIIREVLKNQSEELGEAYENLINDRYLCHFNMLLAKKDVFDVYCEWLFMTIKQIEDLCGSKGVLIEKRQQGYWAEVLMSCYFLQYRKDYTVCYAGHKMLI